MLFILLSIITRMLRGLKRSDEVVNDRVKAVETTMSDMNSNTSTACNAERKISDNSLYIDQIYEYELHKTIWKLQKRYTDLNHIGAGAFGQVCSAKDSVTRTTVAVKKLSRPFQSFEHAKRTYREIKLLTFMNHDNVIDLLNVFTPTSSYEDFQDVYLVFSFSGADLNTHIRSQSLELDQIQLILYQVLRALKYVHSAGIIHRDLKPSNIVVSTDAEVKIIDFGLARLGEEEMTGYVATRYYRAPEIMLNWMHYGQTADIWSVGCIMAEMFTGRTLFPGTGHIDQLKKTLTLLGTPTPELLKKMTSEYGRQYIESLPPTPKREFKTIFPSVDDEALDILEKMLCLDPDIRITAEHALQHPFFAMLSDPDDEPIAPHVFTDPDDTNSRDIEVWRKLVYNLIQERQGETTTSNLDTAKEKTPN